MGYWVSFVVRVLVNGCGVWVVFYRLGLFGRFVAF